MDLEYGQCSSDSDPEISCSKRLWNTKLAQGYEGTCGIDNAKALIIRSHRIIPLEERHEEEIRLKKLVQALPQSFAELKPLFAGVLDDGFSYLVFSWFESTSIEYLKKSFTERMSIYIKCLHIVDDLVTLGHACDDICIDAFRVSSNGNLLFFGLLNSNKFQVTTVGMASGAIKVFCSPEEIIGGQISSRSSIFSLGILGYFLLSGKDPSKMPPTGVNNFLKENMSPSGVSSEVKPWVDDVLGNCLFVNADQRLGSVKNILDGLEEGIKNQRTSLDSIRWMQKGTFKNSTKELVKIETTKIVPEAVAPKKSRVVVPEEQKGELVSKIVSSKLFLPFVGLLAVFLSVSMVIFVFSSLTFVGSSLNELHPRLVEFKKLNTSLEIESELTTLDRDESSFEDRRIALGMLAGTSLESDILLLRYCKERNLPADFMLDYSKILIGNINRLSLGRMEEYLKRYFTNNPNEVCAQGDLLLDLFNPKALLADRLKAVRLIFSSNNSHGIMIAAYLSHDYGDKLFFNELKKYFSARGYSQFPDNFTLRYMVLLDEKLAEVVGETSGDIIKNMPIEDVKLVLKVILDNHQAKVPSLSLLLDRYKSEQQLGAGINKLFEIAKSIENIDAKVYQTIILLGMGSLSTSDVVSLLEWSDTRSEEVIYLGLSVGQPDATSIALLDALHSKGYKNKRGKVLFRWLKENFWSTRVKYSAFISQLVLKELYSDEEIERAFNGLMPVSHHGLFDALVALDDKIFLLEAISRLGMIVESPKLSVFLRHEDKVVRIAAIQALNMRNDLQSLQIILKGFRSEKDEEVREIYRKSHWVTRDREIPRNIQN